MEMMGDGVETRAEMSLMKLACGAQTMDECFVGGRELDARMRARPESSTRIESLEWIPAGRLYKEMGRLPTYVQAVGDLSNIPKPVTGKV
jgi:hypothetical protein